MRSTISFVALVASLTWTIDLGAQQLVGSTPLGRGLKPEAIPGQYIVELHQASSVDAVLRAHGITPIERWQIINGFLARLADAAVVRLTADPLVRSVKPDLVVRASMGLASLPPSADAPASSASRDGSTSAMATSCPNTSVASDARKGQEIPNGVRRIGAATEGSARVVSGASTGAGVKVAVIDTGIDDCHPDLNVVGGRNFVNSREPARDNNGHGTHVAGTIGGRNNAFGVVGVAPEVSLYSLKVLDANGSGALSGIVSALDWALQNGIKVANLSLGAVDIGCVFNGQCGFGAECSAITNATARGMTVIVAAGNSADDAVFYTPGNCRDSVTVTGFVESDGGPGGFGPGFVIDDRGENDDSFAHSFSNFSVFGWDMDGSGAIDNLSDRPIVDLMAPAVSVLSTTPTYPVTLNGPPYDLPMNYGYLTGTSMAAPHVAGAAARYLALNPSATPEMVRRALVLAGECPSGDRPAWLICPSKWEGDPDAETGSEPLVRVCPALRGSSEYCTF